MIKEAFWMEGWDGMGWMDEMVIISRRWSKSTFGVNKVNSTLRNSVKMNSHISDADRG